ncbi:uncharacterized protein A4U43_C08F1440 [Asparagus officinalis]|uniref:ABC transporter B family member 2-like n=1 Tax=Asparagus officinalis TaxID=4686 RepID=UPI00098E81A4|nr:ABC transporter B family member 2-like [Asparagus officinalis]ONK58954.1 uncharacterized protein A4U43_C08F1440 [Asparagus officinalis]
MVLGSIGACVHGTSLPVFFIFFGKLINEFAIAYLSPATVTHRVGKFALYFVYLGVVTLFSSWSEVACWMHTGERQSRKLRLAYLQSVLDQDIGVFDSKILTGELTTAINGDIFLIQDAISEKIGNFMHYMSRFIVGFAIGFSCIWQITVVTLSVVPLIAITGGIYAYIASGFVAEVGKSYAKAGEIAKEVIGNVRTVQAFVGEEKAVKSYGIALLKSYEYGKKGGLVKGLGLGSMYCVLFSSWVLLVWFTSIIVHKKIANGAESFTTMLNVVTAGMSLGQAAPNISTFIRARTVAFPIFQMIERSTIKKACAETGKALPCVKGHIQFCNVHFSYPTRPEVLILKGLNLDVPSGKVVALVGKSGSGKSTVISLMERFYQPHFGVILLDGHDINSLDLKWLRVQIGLVSQEPTLFAASILENILYGKLDATREEIDNATKLSASISFIENLPNGYDTQVGEHGIQLSGGQKQRIAISRAILKNPAILLLDEATSALDLESEKSIQEALDKTMVGRTTLVVAHRLSTVRNADTIAVVHDGKILEYGTHEQLIHDPSSAYALLVRQQEAFVLQQPVSNPTVEPIEDLTRLTSFGSSFCSDKDPICHYASEANEIAKPLPVSLSRLYSMVGPDWVTMVFGTISAFVAGAQTPLFALGVAQALVSYYMEWESTLREVKKITILFSSAAILTLIFHTIQHLNFSIIGERLTLRVREIMFRAILRNEIGWFDGPSNTSSALLSRLETDATLLRTVVVDRISILLQNSGIIVSSFIISFILNWRITLVILATYPLIISGNISEQMFMRGFGGNLSKAYLRANTFVIEAVSNIRTVAAFCSEDKVVRLYVRELEAPSRSSFLRGHIMGIFCGISQFCLYSSYGLALWYGSILMREGLVSFESIIKSFMVMIVTAFSVGDALALAPDIMKGSQMAASVFEVIDRKTEMACNIGEDVGTVRGKIELRGVTFCYPSRPDTAVFNNFDLRVDPGMSLAVVGTSGSGKSSVLALILRFYDPSSGEVLIDGKDIKGLKLSSIRKHIGLVQQEPALFATTIYENILYGKEDATESEVIEAAKLANAHSFISALPEGYSTKVGERGVQLSGGQKQRVAIARAIIKSPAILLLDEATSALDTESECVVQEALDKIMKQRTTVTVAHRLSTIRDADIISVLQEGRIIEHGTHSALMENVGSAYHKLIGLQQQ